MMATEQGDSWLPHFVMSTSTLMIVILVVLQFICRGAIAGIMFEAPGPHAGPRAAYACH